MVYYFLAWWVIRIPPFTYRWWNSTPLMLNMMSRSICYDIYKNFPLPVSQMDAPGMGVLKNGNMTAYHFFGLERERESFDKNHIPRGSQYFIVCSAQSPQLQYYTIAWNILWISSLFSRMWCGVGENAYGRNLFLEWHSNGGCGYDGMSSTGMLGHDLKELDKYGSICCWKSYIYTTGESYYSKQGHIQIRPSLKRQRQEKKEC